MPSLVLTAALAVSGMTTQAQPITVAPATAPTEISATSAATVPTPPPSLILPKGTMVRLMVIREVSSREHQAGHRFALRVDEDVKAEGITVIPVGAKGWGEVVSSEGTSGVGKSGEINARLLYVESGDRRIPLEGSRENKGSGGTGQVVASVIAFGPLGLLMKGNNAKLKAGEILNGYTTEDAVLDRPRTARP
jgi:hypothetical protein